MGGAAFVTEFNATDLSTWKWFKLVNFVMRKLPQFFKIKKKDSYGILDLTWRDTR